MNETTRSLKSIYATSAPIFSQGYLHVFGFIQCTTGQSVLLVMPNNVDVVNCPLCGQPHNLKDSFIPLSIDEFVKEFQQINLDDLK